MYLIVDFNKIFFYNVARKALKIEFYRQKPTQNSKKYFKKFLLKIQTFFFMNFQIINVSYCRFFKFS